MRVPLMLAAAAVIAGGCGTGSSDGPAEPGTSRLEAALLTEADVGNTYSAAAAATSGAGEVGTGYGRAAVTFASDDPACPELADRLAEGALARQPDAAALLRAAPPDSGTIWHTVRLTPVESVLADQRAALACEGDGFTLEVGDPDGEPTLLSFVSSPIDLAVEGWDIVARTTQSPTGDTPGETVDVVAGRDEVLVSLQLTAVSVTEAEVERLTAIALQRAESALLTAQP